MRKFVKRLAGTAAVASSVVAGSAMAAGTDFSGIGAGIDSSTVVTALIGFGAIYAAPGFARWATKKIAGFFG